MNNSSNIEQELEKAYKEWFVEKQLIIDGLNGLICNSKCGMLTYIEPEMCQKIIDFIERCRF